MSDIQYDDSVPSDHSATLFTIDVDLPEPRPRRVTSRMIRDIDLNDMQADIFSSDLQSVCTNSDVSAKDAVDAYNRTLLGVLDEHAPITE